MAPNPVTVSLGSTPFAVSIRVGAHRLGADEPAALGGAGTGPTPTELLLSSLASCKAITAKMYAERKQWPLEGVEAVATATMAGPAIVSVGVELRFAGPLSEEQRGRLLAIAEKCPVQKALSGGVPVESRLAT